MSPPTGQRGLQAIEVSGVFTGFAVIITLLRLYTRVCIVKAVGIEDYFITLAMLCSVGLTICIGIQVEYGMGQHYWLLSPADGTKSLKAFWASLIVYYLSLGLTKTSILLQYRRVFPTRSFQIACWSVMGVVVAYTIWTLLGSIFACIPVQAFWTKEEARCINQFVMWFTNAGINIGTDLAIIILPMPVIRNLNLARRQKQALIGIFAVGGFVCIVSVLRLQSLVAISNSRDPTYDNPPAATWSSVETNVGIICSCLPCLRPLMTRWIPGFSTRHNYGAASGPTHSRSAYGRHSKNPASFMTPMATLSKGSSDDNFDHLEDRIQVVTDIQIKVEDEHGQIRSHKQALRRSASDSSTDTLVRDVAPMV